MRQSPSWDAHNSYATQEMSSFYWTQKVKNQPLVYILSQINPVHALPAYLFNIYFNIYPRPDLPSGLCLSGIRTKTQNASEENCTLNNTEEYLKQTRLIP
jgi:hypothetical protein